MSQLVIRAKVVGLHSNRHAPLGYEDVFKSAYTKDHVQTEATLRLTEEENFQPTEARPRSKKERKGTTTKGTKGHPWFRFVRDRDGEIEKTRLEESLARNIYGALKEVAWLHDGKNWDFPKYRADAGSCHVRIANKPKATSVPTPVLVKLIGAQGSQWQYFESLEELDVEVTLAYPVPPAALKEAAGKLPSLRLGPTGRARLELKEATS